MCVSARGRVMKYLHKVLQHCHELDKRRVLHKERVMDRLQLGNTIFAKLDVRYPTYSTGEGKWLCVKVYLELYNLVGVQVGR